MASLGTLAPYPAGQLDVLGHDGDALGVDGAQVGVLKQTHQVGLAGLLQGERGETEVRSLALTARCTTMDLTNILF